jgi:hypothetical protein
VRSVLASFANALAGSDASRGSAALQRFVGVLSAAGTVTTQKLVSSIDKTGLVRSGAAEPTLGALEPEFAALIVLLKAAGAQKPLVADVELLLGLIRRHRDASIAEFEASAVRSIASAPRRQKATDAAPVDSERLIACYVKRLQAALGNDEIFRALHGELGADRRVTKTSMVEIVSRFFVPMPAGTTRPMALRKILDRHQKLMASRAASASIGGRAGFG